MAGNLPWNLERSSNVKVCPVAEVRCSHQAPLEEKQTGPTPNPKPDTLNSIPSTSGCLQVWCREGLIEVDNALLSRAAQPRPQLRLPSVPLSVTPRSTAFNCYTPWHDGPERNPPEKGGGGGWVPECPERSSRPVVMARSHSAEAEAGAGKVRGCKA